jgi:hypothetical protein
MITFKEYLEEGKVADRKAKEREEWLQAQADRKARTKALSDKLDAMPDPTPEQKEKNDKALAYLIGWQKKYGKAASGS